MRGLTRLARKAFQFSLILAVISGYLTFAWVTPFMHVLATVGHKVSNYRKYGILRAAEEVVRAGVLSYAPGSESVHTFHLSHFHRLVSFCRFVFGCWGGSVCFAVAFFLFTDQSVRSSYQPMTSLAYLHDCHSCYDERSIVQKKSIPIFHSLVSCLKKLTNNTQRVLLTFPFPYLFVKSLDLTFLCLAFPLVTPSLSNPFVFFPLSFYYILFFSFPSCHQKNYKDGFHTFAEIVADGHILLNTSALFQPPKVSRKEPA